MANAARKDGKRPRPKPERQQFEQVVKRLLNTPPLPEERVHRERKGKKKLGVVDYFDFRFISAVGSYSIL